MSQRPRRQTQYPARFMPLDDGGPPPQMTPEVWREPPPVRRRRLPVAAIAPCFFFVNQDAAPADTGEWRYQEPRVLQKKRLYPHEDLFSPPIDVAPADPLVGLEAFVAPEIRLRRFPEHPPSVVRGDVEPGLLEPPQPQVQRLFRRYPQHPKALTEPAHVEPGAIDFFFDPPEILRRRKPPNLGSSFFEAPFVAAPSTDALEYVFRPPYQTWVPRQKKRAAAASIASVVSVAPEVAEVFPWRQPRRARFRVSHQLPGAPNRDG